MSEPPNATTGDLFTDRNRQADMTAWRREALALHDAEPIHRIERAGYDPFWAVIGHSAVLDVERRPALFTNAPQPVLACRKTIAAQPFALRTLVHLDGPDHPKYWAGRNDPEPKGSGGHFRSPCPQFRREFRQVCRGYASARDDRSGQSRYWALAPEDIAEQVIHVINQPWGVAISDITVRATGEEYIL